MAELIHARSSSRSTPQSRYLVSQETEGHPWCGPISGPKISGPKINGLEIRGSKASCYPAERIYLGRLGIDTWSKAALLEDVLAHALTGQQTRQVVTANAQFYVLAEKNPLFRDCLERAEYSCADGMPVAWGCDHLIGTRVPRITGVDLIEDLCRIGASSGLRIFLLGGEPGSARTSAALLEARYPGVVVAGVSCPRYHFETKAETLQPVIDEIDAAHPHLLLVALGAPKQEFFISEHIRPLRIPVAIGIGGSFEIIAGCQARAPGWMQTAGLEWAFRFRQEPRRLWKRYLIGNAEFVFSLAKWWLSRRLETPRSTRLRITSTQKKLPESLCED